MLFFINERYYIIILMTVHEINKK